jgi:hypothetical protein
MSCHCAILTFFKTRTLKQWLKIIEVQQEEELFGMNCHDPTCYATEMLDAKSEKNEIDEAINQLNHLILGKKGGP